MSDDGVDEAPEAAPDSASDGGRSDAAESESAGRLGDRRPEFRELSERLRERNEWSRHGGS